MKLQRAGRNTPDGSFIPRGIHEDNVVGKVFTPDVREVIVVFRDGSATRYSRPLICNACGQVLPKVKD
jgi:hypothetical protein